MNETIPCPHCGAVHTRASPLWRDAGTVIGGMAGAAVIVMRIIGKSSPVLASALLVGSAIGLLWGAQVGRTLGAEIDEALPRRFCCRSCGRKFAM